MTLSDLSVSQLKRAVSIKESIEKLNQELRSILGDASNSRTGNPTRTMTLTQRKKIAAAQKARWAKLRRAKSPARSAKPAAKKSMSAARRKRLSAKLKAYWAAKRAGKK